MEDRIAELKKAFGDGWMQMIQSEMDLYSSYLLSINNPVQSENRSGVCNDGAIISPYFPNPNMQSEPIELPKKSKHHNTAIRLWCRNCRTEPSAGCGHKEHRGRNLKSCNNGSLCYKLIVNSEDGKRFTKLIDVKTYDEAVIAEREFRQEKLGTVLNKSALPEVKTEQIHVQKESAPISSRLDDLVNEYLALKPTESNEETQHLRTYSKEYVRDNRRIFDVLKEALEFKKYPYSELTPAQISDKLVGAVHSYLINEKCFSNRTYGKYMAVFKEFERWLTNDKHYNIEKCFSKVKFLPLAPAPEAINKEDYRKILQKISPENGEQITEGKVREKRNWYRNWLVDSFNLAVLTGARRSELASLRFSSVEVDNNGIPIITAENFKVNRILNKSGVDKSYVYFAVNSELESLLNKLGWLEFKKTGQDRFLIAPEIIDNRERILGEIFSRGFAHFAQKAEIQGEHSFGTLRKRHITDMAIQFGNWEKRDINHESDAVMKNYLDRKAIARAQRNFVSFADSPDARNMEIKTIREKSNEKSIAIEL